MPRIRNLTVAGVLAGATVLGGAGLAGAADDTEIEDPVTTDVEGSEETQELTTFESDELDVDSDEAPTAPDLPDTAAERAETALDEAPAFAEDDAGSTEPEPETSEEQSLESDDDMTDDTATETSEPDNHGQRVAAVAQADDPGPGPEHGPAVAAEAKQNGGSSSAPGQG